ncbi:MAG: isochorismatase family protein [Fimbriimonas sp.]
MPRVSLDPQRSVLVVVDVQTSLVPHLFEGEKLLDRVSFLTKIARLLDVPVLTTEQNPARMGATVPALALSDAFPKMCFGAGGCGDFMEGLRASGRDQVVVVGVETHICVGLTAFALLDAGYEVVVCPDATGARTVDRHKLGMERIRDAGVVPAHSEAVAYEWLGTAEHPRFREALAIVKAHP